MAESVYIIDEEHKADEIDLDSRENCKKIRSFINSLANFCTNARLNTDMLHLNSVHYTRSRSFYTAQVSDGTKFIIMQFSGEGAWTVFRAIIEQHVRAHCVGDEGIVAKAIDSVTRNEVTVPFPSQLTENPVPRNAEELAKWIRSLSAIHDKSYIAHYPDLCELIMPKTAKWDLVEVPEFNFDPTALYRVTNFLSKYFNDSRVGHFHRIDLKDNPFITPVMALTMGELMFTADCKANMIAGLMPVQRMDFEKDRKVDIFKEMITAYNNK